MTPRRLWLILLVLAVLTPLGLWLPARFHAGDTWGEWSPRTVRDRAGFVPEGMAREAERWSAPAPDYAPRGWEARPLRHLGLAYLASALAGLAICGAALWLLGRWLTKKEAPRAP